jgi:uncharacterized protein (TIGR00159 family)
VQEILRTLLNQFRLADAFDIAVAAVLIYIALTWLRERATHSLGLCVFSLTALYLFARWMDMYLTTMMFQYGIIGVVLVFVNVFQQDIRHGIERVASSRWLRRSVSEEPADMVVGRLTRAVSELAEQKIGALIIFPGREPLERHLHGGVVVDAEISEPLLLSIFHPKSPGHDGAVLVEGQRISRLGLHLPLSANFAKIAGGGTRHAAALGLAECCDALAVAVSEERGTVTIAQEGELRLVDATELATELHIFCSRSLVPPPTGSQYDVPRLLTKLLSVFLAVMLWYFVAHQTVNLQRTIVVPIEYRNLPEQWIVDDPKTTHAELTLTGSEQAFQLLDANAVTLSLEVANLRDGTTVLLERNGQIRNLPGELEVSQIYPQTVTVHLRSKPMPTSQ